jgi:hypothetical protein
MKTIHLQIPEIPHGHGLSFKKGIADGLLDSGEHAQTTHETNRASYQRGKEVGAALKSAIAPLVKA